MSPTTQKRVRLFGFGFLTDYCFLDIDKDLVPPDLRDAYNEHYARLSAEILANDDPWDITQLWKSHAETRKNAEAAISRLAAVSSFEELCTLLCIVPMCTEPLVIAVMQEVVTPEFLAPRSHWEWKMLEAVTKVPENDDSEHRKPLNEWAKDVFREAIGLLDEDSFESMNRLLRTSVSLTRGGSDLWILFKQHEA